MNKIGHTYRFVALILALLILFTSAGFVVDMHYCQGQLKTFNFFGEAKSCHDMGEGMKDCLFHKQMVDAEQPNDTTISKKNCCSNKTVRFQADQEQQVQVSDFVVSQQLQQFVIAYVASFFTNDLSVQKDPASFVHYMAPAISRDIYVLLETYRL